MRVVIESSLPVGLAFSGISPRERARAFAMHALAQSRADVAEHGQGRHSLWTGDPGLAIYLWACMHGTADFPTLDVFYA